MAVTASGGTTRGTVEVGAGVVVVDAMVAAAVLVAEEATLVAERAGMVILTDGFFFGTAFFAAVAELFDPTMPPIINAYSKYCALRSWEFIIYKTYPR
jgi:hypothetical protein